MDPDGKAPLRLNRNEYFFHHPDAVARFFGAGDEAQGRRYAPAEAAEALRSGLCTALGLEPQGSLSEGNPCALFLYHGAEDALLKILLHHAAVPETAVVVPSLSWSNYRALAEGLGLPVETFPTLAEDDAFGFDARALDAQLSLATGARLVLLATPNNPTGHSTPRATLERLIAAHARHTFVIDAVYDTFPSPLASLPERLSNAVFVGSLSKFFGLPGLRLGYTVSAHGILPQAFRLALGFNPRSLAAASAALSERDAYAGNWNEMRETARALRAQNAAEAAGPLHVLPTDASFLLVRVASDAQVDTAALAEASGALPKDFVHAGVRYLRFGLGPAPVRAAIERFLALARASN